MLRLLLMDIKGNELQFDPSNPHSSELAAFMTFSFLEFQRIITENKNQ